MSHHPYHALVADFLKRSDLNQDPPSPEDLGNLSFTLGDFTCEVYPDKEETRVTLEVMVIRLDQLPPSSVPKALRMLHGINHRARGGTGIMASLNNDDELIVSKSLPISLTDGAQLGAEMAAMLEAALNLKSLVEELPSSSSGAPTSTAGKLPLPGQFA
jgi:hypothetical protein